MTNPTHATVNSVTKTVRINCAAHTAFTFLANPANWPQWAILNVIATSPSEDPGWWDMTTPHGAARLRIRPDAAHGILDHDFDAPDAQWTVPARVVANGTGTEFMMTFFQPPAFTDAFFTEQTSQIDTELATLKELLESTPHSLHLDPGRTPVL